MADLHTYFIEFNKRISLSRSRQKELTKSKQAVEKTIRDYFRNNSQLGIPGFYIQGSYKMGTMILKKDNTYDVDLAVRFKNGLNLKPKTLQTNVLRAVKKQTAVGAQHRDKCIRLIYKRDFNIDLPVFYKKKTNSTTYYLAMKSGEKLDDSSKMVKWFESKTDKNGQLKRLIKYTKIWADCRKQKMPSGIVLTVLLAKNFKPHKRDDHALMNTLKELSNSSDVQLTCKNPVNGRENLSRDLTNTQKANFLQALSNLINALENATKNTSREKAKRILTPFFGERF